MAVDAHDLSRPAHRRLLGGLLEELPRLAHRLFARSSFDFVRASIRSTLDPTARRVQRLLTRYVTRTTCGSCALLPSEILLKRSDRTSNFSGARYATEQNVVFQDPQLAGYAPDVDWLPDLHATRDVTVWHPAHPRPKGTCVMFLDVREDPRHVFHPEAADHVAKKADAYAGSVVGLQRALDWIAQGAPTPKTGAIYLGGLGVSECALRVGDAIPIEEQLVAGRDSTCQIQLRHGGHSDQNVCARKHATLKPATGFYKGVVVIDLKSTNGTYVDGRRIVEPTLVREGSEIAFAGYFRIRFC